MKLTDKMCKAINVMNNNISAFGYWSNQVKKLNSELHNHFNQEEVSFINGYCKNINQHMDIEIGFSFMLSNYSNVTIKGLYLHKGEKLYTVNESNDLYTLDDINHHMSKQDKYKKNMIESEANRIKEEQEEQEKEERYNKKYGLLIEFCNQFEGVKKHKLFSTLDKSLRYNNIVYSRFEYVEKFVKNNGHAEIKEYIKHNYEKGTERNVTEYRFYTDEKVFFTLTKTEYLYYEWLKIRV